MFKSRAAAVLIVSSIAAGLAGCATTMPTGPTVNVLPEQGKPFEAFQTEDAQCREWAILHAKDAANAGDNNALKSIGAGILTGAAAGGAIGGADDSAGAGALIGGAVGLIGGLAHAANDAAHASSVSQTQYNNAYVQCMYAHGNQIPQPAPVAAVAGGPTPMVMAAPLAPAAPTAEPLYLTAAPMFAYAPEYGMYAALGVPYDLFYDGRMYYYYNGGFWFGSPYYSGPWEFVPREAYLPMFRTYHAERFHEFREREFRRYDHDREHYAGRMHQPDFRDHEVIRHAETEHLHEVARKEAIRRDEHKVAQAKIAKAAKAAQPGAKSAAQKPVPAKKVAKEEKKK